MMESSPSPAPPTVTIAALPGKGRGLVAAVDITEVRVRYVYRVEYVRMYLLFACCCIPLSLYLMTFHPDP